MGGPRTKDCPDEVEPEDHYPFDGSAVNRRRAGQDKGLAWRPGAPMGVVSSRTLEKAFPFEAHRAWQ
jgi:hypothetical protein